MQEIFEMKKEGKFYTTSLKKIIYRNRKLLKKEKRAFNWPQF